MTFLHSGDLGDIISSLPTVRALGGGDYRITTDQNGTRETMFGTRFESLKPLMLAQPYIKSYEWTYDKRGVDVDFTTFRENYRLHENLALQHARHAGVEISLEPWLTALKCTCEESRQGGTHFSWCALGHTKATRPVIARSPRYHHSCFPWRRLLKKHPDAIFVGLLSEWNAFCDSYGEIPFHATSNLLDLAEIIAGANPLITNQTLAYWIGAGLGVPIIQETHLLDMNSVIERPNCKYTRTMEEINAL